MWLILTVFFDLFSFFSIFSNFFLGTPPVSLDERNQHVTVLTETIDALQSTSSRTIDQLASELEAHTEEGGTEEGGTEGKEKGKRLF